MDAMIPHGLNGHTKHRQHRDDRNAPGANDDEANCSGTLHGWRCENAAVLKQNGNLDERESSIVDENARIERLHIVSIPPQSSKRERRTLT